jgi:hypothetical protein
MRRLYSLPCGRRIDFHADGEFPSMRTENCLPCGRRIPLYAGGEFPDMRAENSITCGELNTEGHGLVLTTQHMSIWCSFLVFLNFVRLLLKMKLRIYFYFDYILNFMKSNLIYH